MASVAAQPTFLSTELTLEEKTRCERLWRTFSRDLVEIRPSLEHKQTFSTHDVRFIARLHRFFLVLLKQCLAENQKGNSDASFDPMEWTFVKSCEDSCLRDFLMFAIRNLNDLCPVGRLVFSIQFPEFSGEFKDYELQGHNINDFPDYMRLRSYDAYLYHRPEQATKTVGCAMALAMSTLAQQLQPQESSQTAEQSDRFLDSTKLVVRFLHVQPVIQMMDIKTCLVGKLASVKGHIVKARPKRLRLSSADFYCPKCGATIVHAFDVGRYSAPSSCPTEKCTSRTFDMNNNSTRYINTQELRLQETQDESTAHAGRAPRQLVVEVDQDLVEACRPGDMVQIAATIEAVNTALAAGQKGKRAKETSTYELFLVGHSISTLSESNHSQNKKKGKSRLKVYTHEQLRNITELCHADHRMLTLEDRRALPFDLLVRSLCPSIIGHNEVKAGLLLCLLGGTQVSDRNNSIRYNSHMLIVGDPGMGKSQLLLATNQLAARSVYVGGNTSSTTGLTVTLTKEDKGGQSAIEAGALVLADQGVCCIDEFDKMNRTDGLLEAMEQQQVSIAKAGVVASLPARCSLIAAANPKQGTYNMNKTVSENLNMPKPILSRFDLVFILRDRADANLDRMVSSNIMDLYRQQPSASSASSHVPSSTSNSNVNPSDIQRQAGMSLSDRLAWVTQYQKQPLPADLVRDYIAYAREYCKPKITPEAAEILKDYFMKLRYPENDQRKSDTVPITTRQLEALIRLCQARAKACLRDVCIADDAYDVVDLMKRSVEQVHIDEIGGVDRTRGGPGGKSKRKMKKAFEQELRAMVGNQGGTISKDDISRVAMLVGCGLHEQSDLLEELVAKCFLIRKGNRMYEILPQ